MPEFFIITLLTSAEIVLSELTIHQPAQAVTDITISIPQSVDLCTLCGKISAGNSAGMCHNEPVRVGKIFVIEHVQLHNTLHMFSPHLSLVATFALIVSHCSYLSCLYLLKKFPTNVPNPFQITFLHLN